MQSASAASESLEKWSSSAAACFWTDPHKSEAQLDSVLQARDVRAPGRARLSPFPMLIPVCHRGRKWHRRVVQHYRFGTATRFYDGLRLRGVTRDRTPQPGDPMHTTRE